MLLVFMYHRIFNANEQNAASLFADHVAGLAKQYNIVLPGDPISPNRLSICLTFDDAYFDFYRLVFPILKQVQIKALLAVPVKFILMSTTVDPQTRLGVPVAKGMDYDDSLHDALFCTWQEIKEMVNSGYVTVASHSYSHADLTKRSVNFDTEITQSKQILETQINKPVNTFIYPFGKMNSLVQKRVEQDYMYAMRIGSALNKNWHNSHGITYRIDADPFWRQGIQWGRSHTIRYYINYLSNTVRFK
jgi:peptidoglycan/xylan/chitin deacetylase (PgdA/CDA1 family)